MIIAGKRYVIGFRSDFAPMEVVCGIVISSNNGTVVIKNGFTTEYRPWSYISLGDMTSYAVNTEARKKLSIAVPYGTVISGIVMAVPCDEKVWE